MTPEQKGLVRDSWGRVITIQDQAAELFYGRLFQVYPEVRPLFQGDMAEQGRKLMTMLNTAVQALDRPETLAGPLGELGRRHAEYGVSAADYDKVAEAFLWTLEQGLGDAFTPEVREAWTATYGAVAAMMIQGARG